MRPTIKVIAQLANVSHATVSMVLNNKKGVGKELSAKILKIAEEIGYVPNINAKNLATKNSNTIGVFLINFPRNREDRVFYYYMEFLQDFMLEARKKGFTILFYTDEDKTRSKMCYATICMEQNIKTAIFLGMDKTDPNLEQIKNLKSTQVILFDIETTTLCNTIISDSSSGIREMLLHLHSKKVSSVAVISGAQYAEIATQKKINELLEFSSNLGITLDFYNGDFFKHSGYIIGKKIDVSKYQCIFSMNDAMAIGVLQGLKERGFSIPKDISLIGFDNLLLTDVISPKLSSIAHNNSKLISSIFKIIKNQNAIMNFSIPTTFIKKDSSI